MKESPGVLCHRVNPPPTSDDQNSAMDWDCCDFAFYLCIFNLTKVIRTVGPVQYLRVKGCEGSSFCFCPVHLDSVHRGALA